MSAIVKPKNFLYIKRQCSARSLSISQRRTCFLPYFVLLLQLSFAAGFNITLQCCLWLVENSERYVAANFLIPHSLNGFLHPFGVPFFSLSHL